MIGFIIEFFVELIPEAIHNLFSDVIDERVKNKAVRFVLKALLLVGCALLTVAIGFMLLGFLIGFALKLIGFILLS